MAESLAWPRLPSSDHLAIEATGIEAIERLLHALRERGIARVSDIPSVAFVIHNSVEWIASRLVLGEASPEVIDAAVDTTSEMISRLIFEDAPLT